jgi:hypothetical protein
MALLVKDVEEKEYVQVPNATAKAVEEKDNDNPISLEALGLLVNLWSYDITKWEVHKTELYQRFAKNKKTSVTNAWDELVKANYIIEFKYRVGRKWEYVYIYRIRPYSEEEKEQKLLECVELSGVDSTSDFQLLKFNSSKCTVQNTHISNTELKKDNINKNKELVNKDVNKNQKNLPEKNLNKKQEYDPEIENITSSELNGDYFISITDEFFIKFAVGRWNKEQWSRLVIKLANEILKSEIELYNPKGYIYRCLENIAYRHDLKHGKIEARKPDNDLPFYDWWLEE